VRTPEERDRQTLLIVQALVRFFGVVAGTLCVLAGVSLVVSVPDGLASPLLMLAVAVGTAAAVGHLLRVGRGGRAPH
jgi:hypothetical protein